MGAPRVEGLPRPEGEPGALTGAAGGEALPPGARLGEDDGSPLASDTGANAEPFPAGSAPIEGAPEEGDGLDGTVSDVVEAGGTPITIGRDAIGLP
jgi:hypothetical protein